MQRGTFAFVVAAELGLAVGVIAGSDAAAYAAAALMALFAATLAQRAAAGRAGRAVRLLRQRLDG